MKKWFFDFVKITAAPMWLFYRPKFYYPGGKKIRIKGGALAIANHIGLTDPIYVLMTFWYRRMKFVAMKEFFEKPLSAWFFTSVGCIPIDRKNPGMETFRAVSDALKQEELVALFPEGHVVENEGTMQKFKSGMVLMALQGQKPIVPVYLKPRAHWWQRQRIAVGEPIDILALYGKRPTMREIEAISELLYERTKELEQLTA
ncbi:MAG: 1-acyl-sn-glycerol-3-phosphate acyltransferase [Lachnospiraceae bacterium]|nr:1-acyl-sn-glycerol-3-phosphate acyltransferase [Lachnospiraceae bacterium]